MGLIDHLFRFLQHGAHHLAGSFDLTNPWCDERKRV